MAASIYATPPPDLSNEDTALSDVSNHSTNTLNNNNNNNTRRSSNSSSNSSNNNINHITTNTNHNHLQQQEQQNRYEATSTTTPTTTTASMEVAASKTSIASATIPITTANMSPRTLPAIATTVTTTTTTTTTLGISSSSSSSSPSSPTSLNAHTFKQRKQNISEVLALDNTGQDSRSSTNADALIKKNNNDGNYADDSHVDGEGRSIPELVEANSTMAMNAVAAAANAAMQLRLLEAINDAAKKRRKQHNPSRHEALNLSNATEAVTSTDEQANEIDYEEKLSKMFLPKSIEQLKEHFEMLQKQQQHHLQQQQDIEHISQANPLMNLDGQSKPDGGNENLLDASKNPYHTYCKECGENFETDFKLSLHMLHEHSPNANGNDTGNGGDDGSRNPNDFFASFKVKLEHGDSPTGCGNEASAQNNDDNNDTFQLNLRKQQHEQQQQHLLHSATEMLTNGKNHWLNAMPPPPHGFPPGFSPEAAAAAALSAGGYLPLLGVHGFPGVDGLNRPPLRIFNPEAYCELCNKEFCNKYFLKTHKANKHGIYDPVGDTGGSNNNSSSANNNNNSAGGLNAMNQIFQLQMQQQQQQQQQHQQQQLQQIQMQQKAAAEQQQKQQQAASDALSQQQPPTTAPPATVQCDVCSKRFTNIFAMRRHRAKIHEPRRESPNSSSTQASPLTTPVKTEPTTAQQQQPTNNIEPSTPYPNSTPESKPFEMPEGFRQDFTLEQEEVSFTPQPRKLSPQMQELARDANFAHDKLRRLGVLNPEAYCEVCGKEYCNKYFLRTHKWKRHGIFVPPDDLKDEQLQLAQKMAWPFMNLPGMPINLMLANEKAVAAQRMMAAANVNIPPESGSGREENGQSPKRIKLEPTDQSDLTGDAMEVGNATVQSGSSMPGSPESKQPTLPQLDVSQLPPSPEATMQNIQKLQSMIQQLNDLNGKRPVACHLCGCDCENQYALQAHIMTEHAGLTGLDGGPLGSLQQQFYQQQQSLLQQQQLQQQQSLKLSPNGGSPSSNELRCHQCDRDFQTPQEFKQHITEVHLLPGGSPLREGFFTPDRPINPNAAGIGGGGATGRPPYTITPTSSYCEICNKELCNKYFMKTHMQRMHGIEIENGAQIGGVVCNICNKELCSKYFLRVHKHNTHGIIEEGSPLPQPRGSSSNQNGIKLEAQQQQQQQPQGLPQTPSSLPTPQQLLESELSRNPSMSPFGVATSGSGSYQDTCPLCSRHFRSFKWLRSHLMNDHGAAGIDKLRETEQQYGSLSKSNSPTLKIPNGVTQGAVPSAAALLNPVNLAQALQNLNAQHLLDQKPKLPLPSGAASMFRAAVAEQALQSPRYKEYQCSVCPFTTPYYAFLFIHERSHTITDTSETTPASLLAPPGVPQTADLDEKNPSALPLLQPELVKSTQPEEPTNLSTRLPTPTTTAKQSSPSPVMVQQLEPITIPESQPTSKVNTPSPRPTSNTAIKEDTSSPQSPPLSSLNSKRDSASLLLHSPPTSTTLGNGLKSSSQLRSTASSPIESILQQQQRLLNELATRSGIPAAYALPKQLADGENFEYQMQAFHIESATEDGHKEDGNADDAMAECFMPAIVFLPVKKPINGVVKKLSFNLTPS